MDTNLCLLYTSQRICHRVIHGAGYQNTLLGADCLDPVSYTHLNVVSYFVNEKKNFIGLKKLGTCCVNGAKQAAEIAIPTAACGIIINVVTGQTSLDVYKRQVFPVGFKGAFLQRLRNTPLHLSLIHIFVLSVFGILFRLSGNLVLSVSDFRSVRPDRN